MARVGILGGTFNPPHIAHLLCASEARAQRGLDNVILVPTGTPPHKAMPDEPGGEHRLAMCRLAAAAQSDWLSVSEIELRREGPSYTVDTLRAIHADRPDDELTFIAGGDVAWTLPSWHEPGSVLELAELAVAERAGARREEVRARLASLDGAARVRYIDMLRIDVSSSVIRRRVREGRPIDYLVPDGVALYIKERSLYS